MCVGAEICASPGAHRYFLLLLTPTRSTYSLSWALQPPYEVHVQTPQQFLEQDLILGVQESLCMKELATWRRFQMFACRHSWAGWDGVAGWPGSCPSTTLLTFPSVHITPRHTQGWFLNAQGQVCGIFHCWFQMLVYPWMEGLLSHCALTWFFPFA